MAKHNLYDWFEHAIATMDIPVLRKQANHANANWFIRNAWIANRNHEKFKVARELAIKIVAAH